MKRCPWTGEQFEPVRRGNHEKVFVDDAARAEAHKAARHYTEKLISAGFLTWEGLRRWYGAENSESVPYTARERCGHGRGE